MDFNEFAKRSGIASPYFSENMVKMNLLLSVNEADFKTPNRNDVVDLPVQASILVTSSGDVLQKTRYISQNLPSIFPFFQSLNIPESTQEKAAEAHLALLDFTNSASSPVTHLYINGNPANVTDEDFTIHELINFLQDEDHRLQYLNSMSDLSSEYLIDEMEGEEEFLVGFGTNWGSNYLKVPADDMYLPYRFGIMKDGDSLGVINLSDLENDSEFEDYRTSVKEMFKEAMDIGENFLKSVHVGCNISEFVCHSFLIQQRVLLWGALAP